MNFKDAYARGARIKRARNCDWLKAKRMKLISVEDALADDWEVEQPKATLTIRDFQDKWFAARREAEKVIAQDSSIRIDFLIHTYLLNSINFTTEES